MYYSLKEKKKQNTVLIYLIPELWNVVIQIIVTPDVTWWKWNENSEMKHLGASAMEK